MKKLLLGVIAALGILFFVSSPSLAEPEVFVAVAFTGENYLRAAKRINEFAEMYEPNWYGGTTDDERIRMGGELLEIFDALGYDVSEWAPNTFAQQMNNFYDWRKDMNVWQVACLVLNIDAEVYRNF